MLTPSKAIIAGALVVAIWGVTFIPQRFEQQGGAPGAVTEAVAPTWITGIMQPVDESCSIQPLTSVGGVTHGRYECAYTWTSSDPRLTGDVSFPWNEDTYQTDEGPISVGMDAPSLRNEGGSWDCAHVYLEKGSTPIEEPMTGHTFTCIGDGGYEGLSAVLVSEQDAHFTEEFVGLIFSGDLPPVPEAAATE